jgi:CRP-like cAMP-binding protein
MLLTQKLASSFSFTGKESELLLQMYEKGEEISLLDPGVWQVYRGIIQLSRISQDGKEIIVGWSTVNSAFGNWSDEVNSYRAVALSDVYLKWYSPQEIKNSPELARHLLTQFSDRLIKSSQLLAITGIKRVEERLWQLLLFLQQEMGQNHPAGSRLQIRFTHQHLAQMICTTRVTVTRLLGDFCDRGMISLDSNRHIIIH